MGRKPIGDDLQELIVALRADGWKLDAIWKEVRDPDTERPDRSTVSRHMKKYDLLPEAVKRLDRPFEWHRMEEYGLPWEASAFVLGMWVYVRELVVEEWVGDRWALARLGVKPTVRDVRWWWRIHLADPDKDSFNVMTTAREFADTERLAQIRPGGTGNPFADIEARLAYLSIPDNQDVYQQAVDDKRIPDLRVEYHGLYKEFPEETAAREKELMEKEQ